MLESVVFFLLNTLVFALFLMLSRAIFELSRMEEVKLYFLKFLLRLIEKDPAVYFDIHTSEGYITWILLSLGLEALSSLL